MILICWNKIEYMAVYMDVIFFSHKITINHRYSSDCSKPEKKKKISFEGFLVASEERIWWSQPPSNIQITLLFSIFALFPHSSGFQRSFDCLFSLFTVSPPLCVTISGESWINVSIKYCAQHRLTKIIKSFNRQSL